MEFKLTEGAAIYAADIQEELVKLIAEVTSIPAPSNREEKRAEYIKNWLLKCGANDVFVDEVNNVILPIGNVEDGCNIYMAHIDTVFPDTDTIPVTIKNSEIHAPGVGDDTANVVELMLWIEYILKNNMQPKKNGVLFVFDSCEEGLGDLKGSKAVMAKYGDKAKRMVSFDGTMANVVNMAVGSVRWKVTLTAQGGHSYDAFGNTNAIAQLSEVICALYAQQVPQNEYKTTYNVGTISGGTSVNTIAQKAEMLYEYRSDHRESLDVMDRSFFEIIDRFRNKGYSIEVEQVGRRPCMGEVDQNMQNELNEGIKDLIIRETGRTPNFVSGSTDCNASFAMGIPSICFGGITGYGPHTREEWIEIPALHAGMRCVGSVVLEDFE